MAAAVELAAYKDALIILASTAVTVPLLKRIGISPALAFLGIGLIAGPSVLGGLSATYPWLAWFAVSDSKQMAAFAELGVVFLLFLIGLELSYERLTRMKKLVLGLGSLQVLVTAAIIVLAAWWLGRPVAAALIIGGGLALSSTAVVVEYLAEQRRLTTTTGRATFAILLMQDLAVIPLLFLVVALSQRGEEGSILFGLAMALVQGAAAVAIVVLVGRRVLRPFLRLVAAMHEPQVFTAAGDPHRHRHRAAHRRLRRLHGARRLRRRPAHRRDGIPPRHRGDAGALQGILLGVFFFSVGLSLDLPAVIASPGTFGAALAALIVLKIAVIVPLGRAFGLSWIVAFRTALLLGPRANSPSFLMQQATGAASSHPRSAPSSSR